MLAQKLLLENQLLESHHYSNLMQGCDLGPIDG